MSVWAPITVASPRRTTGWSSTRRIRVLTGSHPFRPIRIRPSLRSVETYSNRGGTPVRTADVVVIGAGTVGASVAYETARRGASVIVLEEGTHIGNGCSYA